MIFEFRSWPVTSNKTAFDTYGDLDLQKILKWYRHNLEEEVRIAAQCEWMHFKYAVVRITEANPDNAPFDVFSRLVASQDSLHIYSICKVLRL